MCRIRVLLGLLFFKAEDGIRDVAVTGVQTCALFFSSRRRHTRCSRDWSSDVCSSDLVMQLTRVIDYLDYLPITTITIENIEADDTMAYITKQILKTSKIVDRKSVV